MKKIGWLLLICILLTGCVSAEAEDFATRFFSGTENEALYELFSDAIQQALPFRQFDMTAALLTATYGKVLDIGKEQRMTMGDQTICLQIVQFEKETLLLQVVINAEGRLDAFTFTPYQEKGTPAPTSTQLPAGVVQEGITIGAGEFALAGLLTLPENAVDVPAVVLVHGSGANDRDEAVGSTKLFADIAYALAQQGIASIRYDKRTYVHGANMNSATLTVEEEMIEDALLAAQLLKNDSRIDGDRIFLLGHSLGGMQAPRIALEADGAFRGMVIVSGSPKALLDIIIAQNQAVIAALPDAAQPAQLALLDKEIARIDTVFALPIDQMQQETLFLNPAYYFYEMQTVDAAETIKMLQIPTLIMQGGGDFQVTVENGLDAYRAALGDAPYVQYACYPQLNHLLMASTATQSIADYDLPLHLDAQAAADIAAFILAQ